MRKMITLLLAGLLVLGGGVIAAPNPKPDVTIVIGQVQATKDALVEVPIYLSINEVEEGYEPYLVLMELEHDPGLTFVQVQQTQGDHITVNPEAYPACGESNSIRFLIVSIAEPLDVSIPIAKLVMRAGPGMNQIYRTCWHRGDPHPVVGAYTFAGDVTFQNQNHEGWDVLDEFPETGTFTWQTGAVYVPEPTRRDKKFPNHIASQDTWSTIKRLYR